MEDFRTVTAQQRNSWIGALRYDTSSHEALNHDQPSPAGWSVDDVREEIRRRGQLALAARELGVDFYRIGYRFSWPLPLDHRPVDWPETIPGIPYYPWLTWVGWALEERWNALDALRHLDPAAGGSRTGGGDDPTRAGAALATEIEALAGWDSHVCGNGTASLITGSVATAVADLLSERSDSSDPISTATLIATGNRIIDQAVLPRFADEPELEPSHEVQNIRAITLITGARLASIIGHPQAERLGREAEQLLETWLAMRHQGYTETVAYDAFLLYYAGPWLRAAAPDHELAALEQEFSATARSWAWSTLPGRPELQAPIGDTEPEMTHWITVLLASAVATDDAALSHWASRLPLQTLPAAALRSALALAERAAAEPGPELPSHQAPDQRGVISLRKGDWGPSGLLAAVATTRYEIGHLHHDAGHLVLGWQQRFWITDPGYQQYRAGDELDYTLDQRAHNVPVIGGQGQSTRAARIDSRSDDHLRLDLSACYPTTDAGRTVHRDLWLADDRVIIRDQIRGIGADESVATHWLGGAGLFWSFHSGWARLSDQKRTLWIGSPQSHLTVENLSRHPGTRGPLTLSDTISGPQDRWWFLVLDEQGGLTPPETSLPETSLPETSLPETSL